MSIEEIVKALRCCANGCCEVCPLLEATDCTNYLIQQANVIIEQLKSRAEKAEAELKNARNELCYKCGKYREAHNGACDGCKWKEQNYEAD